MTSRFDLSATPIDGLQIATRRPSHDERGSFERMFCAQDLQSVMRGRSIVQVNRSRTASRGAVRGMHFQQQPHAELKIVSCLRGAVFDVAVDVRTGSATFLHWFGVELSDANNKSFVIPEGFAHGFQALTENAELLYFHTAAFEPIAEGAIHVQDPRVGIEWPLAIGQLSEKDASRPMIDDLFSGVRV